MSALPSVLESVASKDIRACGFPCCVSSNYEDGFQGAVPAVCLSWGACGRVSSEERVCFLIVFRCKGLELFICSFINLFIPLRSLLPMPLSSLLVIKCVFFLGQSC